MIDPETGQEIPEEQGGGSGGSNRAAAEAYFNTFSAADQAAIRASWGGRDMIEEWYNNAVAAGAVGEGGGTTGSGSTGFTGPGGKPTPAELRAWAKSQGWSEDFARYSDATLLGWISQSWDNSTNKFKSARGAEGSFEKPTECPAGTGPSGPNESDPCTAAGGGQGGGGGGGQGGEGGTGTGTGTGATPGQDWLQEYLMALYGQQGGVFAPGTGVEGANSGYTAHPLAEGGVMWSPLAQTPVENIQTGPITTGEGPNGGPGEGLPEGTPKCPAGTVLQQGPEGYYCKPIDGGPLTRPPTETPSPCPEGQVRKQDGKCYPAPGGAPSPGRATADISGAAALTSATLNAFGPQAPSATAASPTAQVLTPPTVPTPTAVPPTVQRSAAPAAPAYSSSFLPVKPLDPLTSAVNRRYDPVQNQWWAPR